MDFLAAGLSSLISVFALALFVAGVLKLFQIHTVLTEIKDALRAAPRTAAPMFAAPGFAAPGSAAPGSGAPAAPATPTALHSLGSGDDMLRALDAQMKWDESASRTNR